jgi:ATP-dependent DNA helicase RecQ
LNPERLRKALYDLEALGIASNDTALTAFVHIDVERASRVRFAEACALESALIDLLREDGADLAVGDSSALHLRLATQRLRDAGHATALPEKVLRIVRGLANDGRGEDGGAGSVGLRQYDPETVQVTLQREWKALERTAELRRAGAGVLLEHLIACAPARRGADVLAETTLGKLLAALKGDLALAGEIRDPTKLLDRALLWLHEQEIIRLNKGLAVFRPAMTIRLSAGRRGFTRADYEPLKMHYAEQVVQVHIMAEYAERGLSTIAEAVRLAMDYFTLQRDAFIRRWLPRRAQEFDRQTTPASWRAIVESLNNAEQQRIVTDNRERTNVLVLAGPGSGKTRVLVHRIAYLVRVKRESPRGILALAYNRHAAVEIRQRLLALIGDDARGVVVLTCHALAMRLAGVSFSGRAEPLTDTAFEDVLKQAVALLNGAGLPPDEADEQRERLLAGFRWILVDEYQDVGPGQYELISALAGRTLKDETGKLSLFAVGDDDQNIYSFAGASVAYVRRFETDYAAKAAYLTENYRSTADIIAAANAVIEPAQDRMKAQHPITIDRMRMLAPPGGDWTDGDPVGKGRVQVLPAGTNPMTQAVAVMAELERLAAFDRGWQWEHVAVLAREWKYLEPVRSWCELNGVPVQMADEGVGYFWRLRETQTLIERARGAAGGLIDVVGLRGWVASNGGPWWDLLHEAVAAYAEETRAAHMPVPHFLEWLAEWGRDIRRRQTGLLLLTAHRAKGLEFDHVVVLDGNWDKVGDTEDLDAPRRLYYVAMTRAKETLTLASMDRGSRLVQGLRDCPSVLVRAPVQVPTPVPELAWQYEQLSLADVDLGFAGRQRDKLPVHARIAGLEAGDRLTLDQRQEGWALHDQTGAAVGRLSKAFHAPQGMRCVDARVNAIVVWKKEWTSPEYADAVECERWEVVVPELVFAPAIAVG